MAPAPHKPRFNGNSGTRPWRGNLGRRPAKLVHQSQRAGKARSPVAAQTRAWDPSTANISWLTVEEANSIRAKFQPPAEDGKIYVDAVFEGGGVKGTAFLGALRCLADAGISFRKVAGTSAGAITAGLMGSGMTTDEIEKAIGSLDYRDDMLSEKTSNLIFNGSPNDDLNNPVPMLMNLAAVGKLGQYSTAPFKRWLDKTLKTEKQTFGEVVAKPSNGTPLKWYEERELKVVAADITRGEMLVLPDDLPENKRADFSIADAVILSMSIPLFFEPGELEGRWVVDGGILSNFPLWTYDVRGSARPRCPTLGFILVEPEDQERNRVSSAMGVMIRILLTMQGGRDRRYTRVNDLNRVVEIDTLGISTTDFDISDENKSRLYREGYESTKRFLLDKWSWDEHLKLRGFTTTTALP